MGLLGAVEPCRKNKMLWSILRPDVPRSLGFGHSGEVSKGGVHASVIFTLDGGERQIL